MAFDVEEKGFIPVGGIKKGEASLVSYKSCNSVRWLILKQHFSTKVEML